MNTIKIANIDVKVSAIKAYIVHLRKEKIGDVGKYEYERSRLHNNIFLSAGFKDSGMFKARILHKDSPFDDALNSLLCDILLCPRCRISTDRNSFCWGCNRFITLKDNLRNLEMMRN